MEARHKQQQQDTDGEWLHGHNTSDGHVQEAGRGREARPGRSSVKEEQRRLAARGGRRRLRAEEERRELGSTAEVAGRRPWAGDGEKGGRSGLEEGRKERGAQDRSRGGSQAGRRRRAGTRGRRGRSGPRRWWADEDGRVRRGGAGGGRRSAPHWRSSRRGRPKGARVARREVRRRGREAGAAAAGRAGERWWRGELLRTGGRRMRCGMEEEDAHGREKRDKKEKKRKGRKKEKEKWSRDRLQKFRGLLVRKKGGGRASPRKTENAGGWLQNTGGGKGKEPGAGLVFGG